MTDRETLIADSRAKFKLNITPEDQAANLFLFDRGKLSLHEIVARDADDRAEEEIMDRLVGALRVIDREIDEALDPAYDVCPKCFEMSFVQPHHSSTRVKAFKCRSCGHEYFLRRSAS